jgi:hypothetical protein
MVTEEEKIKDPEEEIKDPEEKNKDPFEGLRKILYEQKPETREAEIRAQKNRAKATAFLQAFGTIADAFTLSRGGDVPKRDLNPYITNNMQRADAMGEQDRADKKAWENSLLNLENNVAQYNARQIEAAKQREWEEQKIKNNQEFITQTATTEYERKRQSDIEAYWREQQRRKEEFELLKERLDYEFELFVKKHNITSETEMKQIKASINGQAAIELLRKGNNNNNNNKRYLYLPNPLNPAEMIGLEKSEALLVFSQAFHDRGSDERIKNLIKSKPKGKDYTTDEKIMYVEYIAKRYPEKILEYLGEVIQSIMNRESGTYAIPDPVQNQGQNNTWIQPQPSYPPWGQGPVAPERIKESINDYF